MGTLFALLLPHIPVLIKATESMIKGEKAGVDRKAVIMDALRAIADKVVARKQHQEITAVPGDESLGALIEAEFQRLKQSGELAVAEVPITEQVYIVRGRVTPMNVRF